MAGAYSTIKHTGIRIRRPLFPDLAFRDALPKVPEFLLRTGDLTHLSDPGQFDTLGQLLKECKTTNVFYVPGEHDIYDGGAQYRERFGKDTIGAGWHSFDRRECTSSGW
jgi:3',5'-cyclic AMP phosphodiesterase CpdA